MVWTIPAPLFASSVDTVETTFTSDTYVGDLYTYLGSPSTAAAYTITADACDVAAIIISSSFPLGSTFDFVAINNGRFIGTGGMGGTGAPDFDAVGDTPTPGLSGGNAIQSDSFSVNIDVDAGFLLGGGGGGGGGGWHDLGGTGTPGGGGGGGAGWGNAQGGQAGPATGTPFAYPGTDGSQSGPGSGGQGGTTGTIFDNFGGNGGDYGRSGKVGGSPAPMVTLGGWDLTDTTGRAGGDGGSAFYGTNGATATLNGAKSETTLRTENRIKGELGGRLAMPNATSAWDIVVGTGTATAEMQLRADTLGTLRRNNGGTLTDFTDFWYLGEAAITSGDYEMRYLGLTGGGWDTEPGVVDTWYRLDTNRTFSISATSGVKSALYCVEVGRYNENEACAIGYVFAYAEFEP